jgi:hypothetical protein
MIFFPSTCTSLYMYFSLCFFLRQVLVLQLRLALNAESSAPASVLNAGITGLYYHAHLLLSLS